MSSDTEHRTEDGVDPGLRYHLNMLYGLRAVPEEFMQLARELERRLRPAAK